MICYYCYRERNKRASTSGRVAGALGMPLYPAVIDMALWTSSATPSYPAALRWRWSRFHINSWLSMGM